MKSTLGLFLNFFSRLFASYSPGAATINTLFLRYLILAAFILALVIGLVVVSAVRFNSKRNPSRPAKIFGNRKLEIIWTVIPLLLVGFFFALTLEGMLSINSPIPQGYKPDIEVIAHQWWWELRYPKYGFTTANELHIPVGKKLLMEITSADVIHDLSVPDLGRKIDAIPGRMNYMWFEADKPGVYIGTCNQYCGAEHAWMLIRVIAQPQREFDEWVKSQQAVPAPPSDSLATAGEEIFQERTCGDCHAIAGTPDTADIGPNLTHIASRETILSGMLPNSAANLRRWLDDPQEVKPGALMPNFMFGRNDVNALVAYLEGLK